MPVEHWNCPGRHLNSAARKGMLSIRTLGGGWGRDPWGLWESGSPGVGRPRHPAPGTHDSPGSARVVPAVVPPCHTSTRRDVLAACTQTGRAGWGERGLGGPGELRRFFFEGLGVSLEAAGSGILGGG